jgi:DNA repair protein RadC
VSNGSRARSFPADAVLAGSPRATPDPGCPAPAGPAFALSPAGSDPSPLQLGPTPVQPARAVADVGEESEPGAGESRPTTFDRAPERLDECDLLEAVLSRGRTQPRPHCTAAGGPSPEIPERPWPSLASLSRATVAELRCTLGVGQRPARRLASAFELGRRVERERLGQRPDLSSPELAAALLEPDLRGLDRETFRLVLVDGRHRLIDNRCVAIGTLTTSLVHPREVFGPALRASAAAVIVAHNHPSGDPEPSDEDRDVTLRLVEAGRLLGVPLLDHLVLGAGRFVSLRRRLRF